MTEIMVSGRGSMLEDALVSIQEKLISEGMREYEAKIYVTLFSRGLLSANEIHEFSGVPRGRVYDTLKTLITNGFISSSWDNPVYYTAEPVEKVYLRLMKDTLATIERMHCCLTELQEVCYPLESNLVSVHEFQTALAIDSQVRLGLKRCHEEILMLCYDARILTTYYDDILEAAKRIPVYIVVKDKQMAKASPIKCYMVRHGVSMMSMELPLSTKRQTFPVLVQFSFDRQGTLTILENTDGMLCIGMVNNIAEFVAKSIILNIEKIEPDA